VTALFWLAVSVGLVYCYGRIGRHLATAHLAVIWQQARENWSTDKYVKSSAKSRYLCWCLLWPLMLTGEHLWRLDNVIQGDPVRMKRRIDELERELGMKR
jgi:hypothetical protein